MTVSNYDSEAVGWSRAIRQRRNALTQRLFLGCTAALVFTQPIRKRDYLVGRMRAAFLACLVVFLVIAGAMLLTRAR